MRKSLRGAIVGAALLPLAVAAPGLAFAGSTGDDTSTPGHAYDHGDHEKETSEQTEAKPAESPLPELPEPLAGAAEMLTSAAPELPVG